MSKTPSRAPAKVRKTPQRRRPAGRNPLQDEQRRASRRAILDAARTVFAKTPYVYATVDDILAAADLGRTTFYMHFDGKIGVVKALLEEVTPGWREVFLRLADLKQQRDIEAWIESIAEVYRRNGAVSALMLHAATLEEDFHRHMIELQNRMIDELAERLPVFRLAQEASERGREMRIRAKLLLTQLDQVCYELAMRDTLDNEREVYVRVMAKQVLAFLRGG